VVVLEELAADFGMRTADAIQRVQQLESIGRLTGVIDDRGKFIFVTPEEMSRVSGGARRHAQKLCTHAHARTTLQQTPHTHTHTNLAEPCRT
jgi:hypothetical protein